MICLNLTHIVVVVVVNYSESKVSQNFLHFEGEVKNLKENYLIYLDMALRTLVKEDCTILVLFLAPKSWRGNALLVTSNSVISISLVDTIFKLYAGMHLCKDNLEQVLGLSELFYFRLYINDKCYSCSVWCVLFTACCDGISLLLAKSR